MEVLRAEKKFDTHIHVHVDACRMWTHVACVYIYIWDLLEYTH